jgi:hypothetical protein
MNIEDWIKIVDKYKNKSSFYKCVVLAENRTCFECPFYKEAGIFPHNCRIVDNYDGKIEDLCYS